MKLALADVRTSASILTLFTTCACGADPAQSPLGTSGTSGISGTSGSSGSSGSSGIAGSPLGGAGAGGTSTGAGATNGGTANGGAAGTSGSSGGFGGGGAPPGSPTFTQVAAILQANCGSKCHSGEREDIINLAGADPETLYSRLTSPLDTDLCYQVVPVQRGSAATSLLARVVKAEVSAPCPLPRMPAGCAETNECLKDADIAVIDGWISAGAYKN